MSKNENLRDPKYCPIINENEIIYKKHEFKTTYEKVILNDDKQYIKTITKTKICDNCKFRLQITVEHVWQK
jgi:hypothetical protein